MYCLESWKTKWGLVSVKIDDKMPHTWPVTELNYCRQFTAHSEWLQTCSFLNWNIADTVFISEWVQTRVNKLTSNERQDVQWAGLSLELATQDNPSSVCYKRMDKCQLSFTDIRDLCASKRLWFKVRLFQTANQSVLYECWIVRVSTKERRRKRRRHRYSFSFHFAALYLYCQVRTAPLRCALGS